MSTDDFFTYAIIPFRDLKLAGEQLIHINSLRRQGWLVTYQQLMVFEGEPMLVVVLERGVSTLTHRHQATTEAVSLPPYDHNAGLAVPFTEEVSN